MDRGSETTKMNWQTLRRLALHVFTTLHESNPDWSFEDLQRYLNLPTTKLFLELAEEAGFKRNNVLSGKDESRILKLMLRGVIDPEAISQETGLSASAIRDLIRETGIPFGAGGYGAFAWTNGKDAEQAADDRRLQRRRISKKGQFSYNGRVYGLGSSYGGRACWIEEADNHLVVHCADQPPVTLHK